MRGHSAKPWSLPAIRNSPLVQRMLHKCLSDSMSIKLLITLCLFFGGGICSWGQDTLSFTGYLATNGYYVTPIFVQDGLSKGPDGSYQQIEMDTTLTNLIAIGSFLV